MSTRAVSSLVLAVGLPLSGCPTPPEVDACCACLTGKAPDGTDTEDPELNCLADEDAVGSYDDEVEKCPDLMSFAVQMGGDNAQSVLMKADGCRESCLDACTEVDPNIAFETPVISAGTMTATVGGTPEEATNVTVNQGPYESNLIVNMNTTTPVGAWTFLMSNIPSGAGSYNFAPWTDFGLVTSLAGDASGTYNVTTLDDRTVEATFTGTIQGGTGGPVDPVTFDGTVTADFTVNDGEVSGLLGLD